MSFFEGLSILLKQLEKFMRHILPGYIFLSVYAKVQGLEIVHYWQFATEIKLMVGAFLGIILYSFHKVIWNLVNVLFFRQNYALSLVKNRLYANILVDINYRWAILHLYLITVEIIVGTYWAICGLCPVFLGILLFVFAVGCIYYWILMRVMKHIYFSSTDSLETLVNQLNDRELRRVEPEWSFRIHFH